MGTNEGQGFKRPKSAVKAKKLQNIQKMLNKSRIPLKSVVDLSYATLSFISILWTSWHFLAFKIPGLHLSPLF